MMKDIEHHQQMQQGYPAPGQMPSAPPTYDEAVHNQGAPYPQGSSHAQGPYPQGPPYPQGSYPQGSAYPQGAHYPQGTQYPSTFIPPEAAPYYVPPIVEVQRTTIIALPLGPNPARVKCPHCHADVLTRTESIPSCAAHLCCLLILLIGCCPFSSLPYCMDSMRNVRHICPNCKVFLGSYQP